MAHAGAHKAVEAARQRREANVRAVRQLLAEGRQQWVHQVVIVDGPADADVPAFLRDVGAGRESHALVLRSRNVPGTDPVHDVLTAAVWHRTPDGPAGADQLHYALVRTMPRGSVPVAADLLPLLQRDAAGDPHFSETPPPAFASYLPAGAHKLLEVLRSVDAIKTWWLFIAGVDLGVASLDCARALVALPARDVRVSVIVGTNLTPAAARIVDAARRDAPDRIHLFPIEPVPHDGARARARPPMVDFMLPHKEAREATGKSAKWNDRVIGAVIALIRTLGRVHDEQVEDLAEVLGVPELHRLLEDFEDIRHDLDHFSFLRQPLEFSAKDVDAEVMAITETLVTDREWHHTRARSLLRNLPKRAAGGWHSQTEHLYRALLTTAYRYVRWRNEGTAIALFDQTRRTDDSSDTRFLLLYELFRDSQHLSVVDYALDRMSDRHDDSSFDEMRMFRQACMEAQRYNDRSIFEQLTALAHRERLKKWVVPEEIEAIGRGVAWTGGDPEAWVAAFEKRLSEFRLTVSDLDLTRPVVFHDQTPAPPPHTGPSPRNKRKRARRSA